MAFVTCQRERHTHPPHIRSERISCLSPLSTSVNKFDRTCFLKTRKKTTVKFSCKNNLQFLAPLMGFTLTEHSNQHRSFFHQLITMHALTVCNWHLSYWPINVKRAMRMYQPYGIRGCRTWCECFSNSCLW